MFIGGRILRKRTISNSYCLFLSFHKLFRVLLLYTMNCRHSCTVFCNNFVQKVVAKNIVRTYILMMLGFMFDIADGFGDGINMICESIMGVGSLSTIDNRIFSDNGFYIYDLIVAILGLAVVFAISLYEAKNNIQLREVLVKKRVGLQLIVTTVILLVVIIFGVYGPGFDSNDFVYMQF